MENIELIDKVAASAGFLGVICLGISFVFYKLYTGEKADRREAWKSHSDLVEKTNQTVLRSTIAIEALTKIMEDIKDAVYHPKK